ncbi:MAG: DUF6677 family protein [Pyrinomonadaceae bacterium]
MSQANSNNSQFKAWLAALVGWLIPGAGHLSLGYVVRGLSLGLTVWVMFFIGVACGGHLHNILERSAGVLSNVFGLCDLGVGLLFWVARGIGYAVTEQSRLPTAEYGNIFLMVAGLMNYLLALDAFDLGVGRKS